MLLCLRTPAGRQPGGCGRMLAGRMRAGMCDMRCSRVQVMSSDQARSEALRQRLSDEGGLRMPAASMDTGSSSFAALFGGGPAAPPQSAFASAMARRDSTSSQVSSRLDDLGINLDLPGLQVRGAAGVQAHGRVRMLSAARFLQPCGAP